MSQFTKPPFLNNSNIYEVNLRQYTPEGTIRAFMQHLPRLHDMGVEILWLMPIHPIGVVKRKGTLGSYYSISNYLDINPEFGSKEDFKALVKAVHDYDMKIIIDWVANHTSWDNVWTKTNPEFFIKDEQGNFKPPFDWDDVLQIDHNNEAQQAAMTAAMKYWVTDFDIDGFRADLAHLTPLPFWINARKVLSNVKTDLTWLAETEDINYYEAFDIIYAWKWMHATENFVKHNHDLSSLTRLLQQQQKELPPAALQLYFTGNHDENSWNGTEYEKYGVYAKAFAVFNYTYGNSAPLIYSGQENPLMKRLKFFEKDLIDWKPLPGLHDFYKTLISFHKNDLAGAELHFLHLQKNVLAYSRKKDNKEVLVFLNLDTENASIRFHGIAGVNYKNIFTGENIREETEHMIELQPGEYAVFNNY